MAVIGLREDQYVVMGRQLFYPLMEALAAAVDSPEDRDEVQRADDLDGLHLDLLPTPQALRIAGTLAAIADGMRADAMSEDPTARTNKAELLGELSMYLAGYLEDHPSSTDTG